ncbi:MAG: glycosyltransferase family 2 protein [Chloroflexota bacterium]
MTENLPSISIVTPSLNQGRFIEATIQSVLAQGYPSLEYIVADGGSTDGTLEILEKYDVSIRWFSEKDNGQTNAINKGLKLAGGAILAYLNADDILLPGALRLVAEGFLSHPEAGWITGRSRIIDERGNAIRSFISLYKNALLLTRSHRLLLVTNYISQPATFWRRALLDQCGLLDESFNFVMDYEYWLRLWKLTPPLIIHRELAGFRIQKMSKTTTTGHLEDYIEEEKRILRQYAPSSLWKSLHALHRLGMTRIYSWINRS